MTRRGDRSLEKEAFWRLAVEEWKTAGTTIREFCRSNGLKESAFYFWRRELARRAGLPALSTAEGPAAEAKVRRTGRTRENSQAGQAPSPTAMILPLTLRSHETAAAGGGESGSIEIVVGGHRLRVSPGFDEETLKRLLRMLAA
ncbi:MAG: hypothetical protein ICCCNLDF_03571 [Planctomycetes bacterium]|nr:hypothetical protein [Planctomycetota bacterium]